MDRQHDLSVILSREKILQAERSLLYLLRGYMELCIYPPRPHPKRYMRDSSTHDPQTDAFAYLTHVWGATSPFDISDAVKQSPNGLPVELLDRPDDHEQLPLAWSCSEKVLMQMLHRRDPAGHGLQTRLALRLVLQLLHWSPHARPTPSQALLHAYFSQTEEQPQECHDDRNVAGWC